MRRAGKILAGVAITAGVVAAVSWGIPASVAFRSHNAYAGASNVTIHNTRNAVLDILEGAQRSFIAGAVDVYTETSGGTATFIIGKEAAVTAFPAHYDAGRTYQETHTLSLDDLRDAHARAEAAVEGIRDSAWDLAGSLENSPALADEREHARFTVAVGAVSANVLLAFTDTLPAEFAIDPRYAARIAEKSSLGDPTADAALAEFRETTQTVMSEFTADNGWVTAQIVNAINDGPSAGGGVVPIRNVGKSLALSRTRNITVGIARTDKVPVFETEGRTISPVLMSAFTHHQQQRPQPKPERDAAAGPEAPDADATRIEL